MELSNHSYDPTYDDLETHTERLSLQEKLQRKYFLFKTNFSAELKEWPQNINCALAIAVISLPVILSQVDLVNLKSPPGHNIPYWSGFAGMILGYILSFLIHGGGLLYKSFTDGNTFMVMIQNQTYGIRSLPATVVGAGLLILLMVYMKLHKVSRMIPYCILVGFQFSVGKSC